MEKHINLKEPPNLCFFELFKLSYYQLEAQTINGIEERFRSPRMTRNPPVALNTDDGLELGRLQPQSTTSSQLTPSVAEFGELNADDEAQNDYHHQGQDQQTPLLHGRTPRPPSTSPLPSQSSAQTVPDPVPERTATQIPPPTPNLSKGLTKRQWQLKALYICSLFLLGVASAISHHFFYRSRRNTPAADAQQQQWWNNIGVFFAGLTAAFLGAASTGAYYQYFWVVVHNIELSLNDIDRLFSPSFTGLLLLCPRSFRFWKWRLISSTRWIAPACLMSFVCL